MLRVHKLVVGQLKANCYLVIDDKEALIIDSGDDADYIMRVIADEDVNPIQIVATHGHYDHILAATELKLGYNIPFLMHRADEFLLERMASSAEHFSKIKPGPPPEVDKYLKEGELLRINHQSLTIIHTPGHTPGSISLYSIKDKIVFVGDLVFAEGGVGRVDLAYSNPHHLENSIGKILKLPKDTVVYSGHGDESTVGECINYFTK